MADRGRICWRAAIPGIATGLMLAFGGGIAIGQMMTEKDRERAYLRQQFARHFKAIQESSNSLVRAHDKKSLTVSQLSREVKSINRSAKSLRTMLALGELATPQEQKTDLASPEDFDRAIQRLASLIWDFSHNPIHQNSKVFNTRLAARAQTDLASIISISKAIAENSAKYVAGK